MAKKPKPRLKISNNLSLGLDAITKTFAILAQRRKGKTYTASVMAEEMVKAGQPWVALDPTGAWWGLRSGASGSSRGGLPVYVFGGQHGDLPLERTAGKVIADLVVDKPGHYVLDLSAFESKEAERQFATDFAERLYRRKAKKPDPLHVFIDEADVFVPQRIAKGYERMVGAFEALVRRGGIRGIGVTLISQRAAIVNKNVLEQIDVLVILRIVGPNDQKAIMTYVEAHGTDEERKELKNSMASLKLGEAWMWEPGSEPSLFERIVIRERHTFNSSATPNAASKSAATAKLATVDLDVLRDQIEATIEQAEEEDPTILHKLIRERDKEITKLIEELAEAEQIKQVEPVEVQTITLETVDQLKKAFKPIEDMFEDVAERLSKINKPNPFIQTGKTKSKPKRMPPPRRPAPENEEIDTDFSFDKATRSIMTVLLQYEGGREKKQLAVLAGYSSKGGAFNNALSKLRTAGLIEGSRLITTTVEGDSIGLQVDPLPAGEDLLNYWMERLGKAEREILTVLYEDGGNLSKQEIAELTESGYNSNGGGFNNALSALRTRDLIEGRGDSISAASVLFE